MDQAFREYDANYLKVYGKLSFIEKLLHIREYEFLDYKNTINRGRKYGLGLLNSRGIKYKIISEEPVKDNPNYIFYTVRISAEDEKYFIMTMKDMVYHMYIDKDEEFFHILNKNNVYLWNEGRFKKDPADSTNLQRIEHSLQVTKAMVCDLLH